ncbi:MAG: PAS domain S-box protein, partial [Bacteroidia bacterium]|nr:PAS domain S-box protein [Bacteroidia bacterium]
LDYNAFLDRVSPEDRNYVDQSWQAALKGAPYDIEHRILVGKTEKWVREKADVEFDKDGRPLRGIGVVQDITKRKKAEEDRDFIHYFSRNLIQKANVIIIGLDKQGNITLVNPAAERISGYSIEELQNKNWFEVLVPLDRYQYVHDEFNRLITGGLPKLFQNPILTKSGEERFISWSNNEVMADGEIIGTISYGLDITEQKMLEQQAMKYQERLKALATELTQSEERQRMEIATVLHDHIGQILASSRLQLTAILQTVQDEDLVPKLKAISENLRQVVLEIRNLIFDLSSPILNELGLVAAIKDWLEEQVHHQYGIQTELHTEHQKFPLEEEIRTLLFRSIKELLNNVINHANANCVKVSLKQQESNLSVTVYDDGIGFNYNADLVRIKNGGGFGLFSIQERMQDIGGQIEIKSSPGRGTKVVLEVPLKSK